MMNDDIFSRAMEIVDALMPVMEKQEQDISIREPKRPQGVTDEMLRFMDGMKASGTKWPGDKLKQRFMINDKLAGQVFQYWFDIRRLHGVDYFGQVKLDKER